MNSFRADVKTAMEAEKADSGIRLMRYNKISEMTSYAQPMIVKMADKCFIGGAGTAKDENNQPADLNLSIDVIQVCVTNDRAGPYVA